MNRYNQSGDFNDRPRSAYEYDRSVGDIADCDYGNMMNFTAGTIAITGECSKLMNVDCNQLTISGSVKQIRNLRVFGGQVTIYDSASIVDLEDLHLTDCTINANSTALQNEIDELSVQFEELQRKYSATVALYERYRDEAATLRKQLENATIRADAWTKEYRLLADRIMQWTQSL